jgi:recombination protein RecT
LDNVTASIKAYQTRGELQLPPDYSVDNAMKAAWLMLQGVVNRDNKPVLETCTRASIINALLSMAIQGLNPDKKQCYFIAYGDKVNLQRSYFGAVAVTLRVDQRIEEIVGEIVYAGDEFDYEIRRGKKYITHHKQAIENVDKSKIKAAYVYPIYRGGEIGGATIKTMDEIKQSWQQSQMKPVNADGSIQPNSTHGKFTAAMAMKTVINAFCKPIINNSNDSSLFVKTVRETEMEAEVLEIEAEITDNANGALIDPDAPEVEGQQKIEGVN